MKLSKAIRRDAEIQRRRTGHVVDNKGIFLQQEEQRKRAEKIKQERKQKEELQEASLHE